jgi:hypothetical protein
VTELSDPVFTSVRAFITAQLASLGRSPGGMVMLRLLAFVKERFVFSSVDKNQRRLGLKLDE